MQAIRHLLIWHKMGLVRQFWSHFFTIFFFFARKLKPSFFYRFIIFLSLSKQQIAFGWKVICKHCGLAYVDSCFCFLIKIWNMELHAPNTTSVSYAMHIACTCLLRNGVVSIMIYACHKIQTIQLSDAICNEKFSRHQNSMKNVKERENTKKSGRKLTLQA